MEINVDGLVFENLRALYSAISSTSSTIQLKATLGKLDLENAIELSKKISEYSQHLSTTIDDFREFFKPNKDKKNTTLDILQNSSNLHSKTTVKVD